MRCLNCGSEMPEGTKFCVNCGNPMPVQSQAPVQPQQPVFTQPQVPPVPPAPAPEEPVKKKSKVGLIVAIVALVAAIFGGGLYAGSKYFGQKDPGDEIANVPDIQTPDTLPDPEPEPEPVPTETIAKQTIMLYIIGSDLESGSGLASRDLMEIRKADLTDETNLVIQTGGCTHWDNSFCKANTVQRFFYRDGKFNELEDLGRISMATPGTLSDFVSFAAGNYPAEDYVLILWDHGGGIPIGYGIDELFPNDMLYDYQIGHALEKTGVHFDSIIFDACNMCTLEVCLALKPVADYVIGAESYVNGTGLAYTNWLSLLATSPVSRGKYREQIVSDYMEYCKDRGMVGSMSVISLSHIDGVYKAYTDYISLLKSDLEHSGYPDITIARDNCGVYLYTDSVDLVTLANKYENEASTALINSVVNAVDYTESDFAQGHGITAYYPYDYSDSYDYGRLTFQALQYDKAITDFYDEYVSLAFAYNYGTDNALRYAGDWYRSDIIDSYLSSGHEVAEAGEYHLECYSAEYADGIEHYYMPVSDIDWLDVESILFLEGEDGTQYYLGQDQYYYFDTDGDLIADTPESWTYLSDRVACYIVYDYYNDDETGEWNQCAMIPVEINGVLCYLLAYYDQDVPGGMITGYTYMDSVGEYYYELEDDDEIQVVWYDATNDDYVEAYDPFYASELELDYSEIDFTLDNIYVVYQVTDVYGNIYTSDAFRYENGELTDVIDY